MKTRTFVYRLLLVVVINLAWSFAASAFMAMVLDNWYWAEDANAIQFTLAVFIAVTGMILTLNAVADRISPSPGRPQRREPPILSVNKRTKR